MRVYSQCSMFRGGLATRLKGVGPKSRVPSTRTQRAPGDTSGKPFPPRPVPDGTPRVVDDPPQQMAAGFWDRGIMGLIRKHGAALALYYFAFNESCVLGITYLLHYDYFAVGDIANLLKYVGAERLLDIDNVAGKSKQWGPITISAKFIMNFTIASSFMSLFTGFQIPFCIATLPWIRQRFAPLAVFMKPPKWPVNKATVGGAAAAAEDAAAAAAAAEAPKRTARVVLKRGADGAMKATTVSSTTGGASFAAGTSAASATASAPFAQQQQQQQQQQGTEGAGSSEAAAEPQSPSQAAPEKEPKA